MGTRADGGIDPQAGSLSRLHYRRQFFLGPRFLEDRAGWYRVVIDGKNVLTVHPDLEVAQAGSPERSVTLIGYALDPDRPEATNAEVAQSLLRSLDTLDGCIERTSRLGGRWVLVVNDGRRVVLFHDATGQRQVHHAWDPSTGSVVASTQPGLVAAALHLERDPAALAFMAARGGDDGSVFWMPGDRSVYREIRALLPNHHLDLGTGQVQRYWPVEGAPLAPTGDAIQESARLLRGLMEAARRRFPLALSMTAGWDSRLMLALARDVISEVYCFTLLNPGTPRGSRDVAVPARLFRKLGLTHHVLEYPEIIDPDFRQVFRTNNEAVKDTYCADVQAIHEAYPAGRVCITGDVAEIVKCFLRKKGGGPVSPTDLARLTEIGEFPFALEAFEDWLRDARPGNLDLLDLFCWEQTAGRWQALIRAEYDIVQEAFAPLNCRSLLTTMLSIEEKDRRPPRNRFLRSLIDHLWSDVLSEPINPREPLPPRAIVGLVLRKLRLYEMVPDRFKRRGSRQRG